MSETNDSGQIIGRVHSLESFGAADGPGVRFVIFLQGCKFRCRYCHNPDTWEINGGEPCTADSLLEKALRCRSYWRNGGGITVSGGEPLLQIDFVAELFRKAKAEGINTCLDTAGGPFTREEPFFSRFRELMKYTDLVLLDIKEIDPAQHKYITGEKNDSVLDMARYLSEINKPVRIRHVLVPSLSDRDDDLDRLGEFIGTLKNVEMTEVLPYHSLGKFKWKSLGIPYTLENECAPSAERVLNAKNRLSRKRLDKS